MNDDALRAASFSPYVPLVKHQPIMATSLMMAAPLSLPSITIPRISLPSLEDIKAKTQAVNAVSSNLSEKLFGDVLVAGCVTFIVAPFVSVVDKAIVQRAAGTHTLVSSGLESLANIAKSPVNFVKSPMFLIMWGVYGATYSTANSLKTIVEHREYYRKSHEESQQGSKQYSPSSSTSTNGKMGIFLGTAFVNSATSLMRDKAYARMFGTTGAAASIPLISYGLWAARDGMVIGSSFILPEIVSQTLEEQANINKTDALRISQIACPVVTQFVAGPLQLLGLDFYNRPLANMGYSEAAIERTTFLVRNFWSVVAARIARIAPGYGIGGVLNTQYRDKWRDHLIRKEIRQMELEQDLKAQKESANRLVGLVAERHAGQA